MWQGGHFATSSLLPGAGSGCGDLQKKAAEAILETDPMKRRMRRRMGRLEIPSAGSTRRLDRREPAWRRPWDKFPIAPANVPAHGDLTACAAYLSSMETRMRSAVRSTPSLLLMMEQVLATVL